MSEKKIDETDETDDVGNCQNSAIPQHDSMTEAPNLIGAGSFSVSENYQHDSMTEAPNLIGAGSFSVSENYQDCAIYDNDETIVFSCMDEFRPNRRPRNMLLHIDKSDPKLPYAVKNSNLSLDDYKPCGVADWQEVASPEVEKDYAIVRGIKRDIFQLEYVVIDNLSSGPLDADYFVGEAVPNEEASKNQNVKERPPEYEVEPKRPKVKKRD